METVMERRESSNQGRATVPRRQADEI